MHRAQADPRQRKPPQRITPHGQILGSPHREGVPHADLSLFPPSATIAGDDLQVGGRSLREMAERFGTPAYVIDEQALRSRARDYLAAFTRLGMPAAGSVSP